jgi:hypothetical protein
VSAPLPLCDVTKGKIWKIVNFLLELLKNEKELFLKIKFTFRFSSVMEAVMIFRKIKFISRACNDTVAVGETQFFS